ncbi:Phospholipase D active site motif containing protein [Coccidioides posadasii C735 delta SOWgp]|uniref:Phospholipase n=1 Tax=Coccidioides posadasii (strain C735) TaxID=222929 RepID=C5PDT2_COCP7|nr:Phospholipase D active site motif containing protein [Coccidioides posadasii C735 delta SOWgp]EER25243.1 Phospholipase D active site motif containing protein [Coccidioides posadasii C735 delta SOWgp]|eukprot:XP_003067388.1 Phospholipase D active site motif containing protein [Coccidioides posadasii C735 delta SOWgp]
MAGNEDHMAYGDYPGQKSSSTRGLLGDTFNKFRDKYNAHTQGQQQQHQQQQQSHYNTQGGYPSHPPPQGYGQPSSQGPPPPHQQPGGYAPTQSPNPQSSQGAKPPKSDLVSGLLGKVQGIGSDLAQKLGSSIDPQAYATYGTGTQAGEKARYGSFAPERDHNDAKWYVDGCTYMWAVSRALETAKESIWILDWWLSPELYLRRPPSKNEQYRVDRMLQAAAQRGVKVNVIVYKEVTQALSLSSSHTKHHLEDLHPNIAVFRHPDHLPDRQTLHSGVISSLQNLTLNPAGIAKLSGDALKGIYGMSDNVILYWAHHEKLCIVDGKVAFMGGLDLCFGRWDTYHHSISDVHPNDIKETVFSGQDYNNARILDFQDVVHWEKNELDRKTSPRMGWSDVAVSLHGPVVEDLRKHFVDRWNFIYDEKYAVRKDTRYSKLVLYKRPLSSTGPQQHQGHHQGGQQQQQQQQFQSQPIPPSYGQGQSQPHTGTGAQPYQQPGQQYPPPPPGGSPPQQTQSSGGYQPQWSASQTPSHSGPTQTSGATQAPYFPPPPGQGPSHSQTRGIFDGSSSQEEGSRGFSSLRTDVTNFGNVLRTQLAGQVHRYQDRYFSGQPGQGQSGVRMGCQIVRSCSKWSHGTQQTETSIAEAYCTIIRESEHFVYIENQFFITATGDSQAPVKNKIGAAIVERILRAARAKQKYHIVVVIPAVPGFPGDLRDEGSLGTRAIMEFQYDSINRGGNSIMEMIAKEGVNPMEYIRFYNLRNYDRINASGVMQTAEKQSGVSYETARHQYDAGVTGSKPAFDTTSAYGQYQQAAQQVTHGSSASGRWNSVASCYMLGGEDIRNVPWEHNDALAEIDAFVSEELYVHSKVLIADDRTVICGSANINDRSQLGSHDSEIAVIIQDPSPIESSMNGQPYLVSRFASTLRRQLCRKHLGLIPAQDYQRPDANFEPVGVPNQYDLGSPEDRVVADPLSDTFQSLWNSRARQNTEVYRKVFHAVPDDTVRNWNDYKEFYEYYFRKEEVKKQKEGQPECQGGPPAPGEGLTPAPPVKYECGHVIRDEFPEGVRAVKEELSKVKGTLVEMPLMFLIEEDIAKEGIGLNKLTEEIYT